MGDRDKVEYDGGIQTKLVKLREGIQLDVRQQFIEHTQRFERQLRESVQQAEEAAVRRSYEHFTPRVDEIHPRIPEAVAPVREECQARFDGCRGDIAGLREELRSSASALDAKFLGLVEELRGDLREGLRRLTCDYTAYVDEAAAACDERAAKPPRELAVELQHLREDVAGRFAEARERTEARHASALEALRKEATALATESATRDAERRKEIHDTSVELSACLAKSVAELGTQIKDFDRVMKSFAGEGLEYRRTIESNAREHRAETAGLHSKHKELEAQHEAARTETERLVKALEKRLAEEFAEKIGKVEARVTSTCGVVSGEILDVRQELENRVARALREVIDSAAAAATTNAEALGRVAAAEASLDRQRRRLESTAADLTARCDAAAEELAGARAGSQKETAMLGNELTNLRAASTSLTHGVFKALQVIGLLRDEYETPTPRCLNEDARPRSLEVGDLLEWERTGRPLAARVGRNWGQVEAAGGAPTILALVGRKAEEQDLRQVSQALRLAGPPGVPAWMASTGPAGAGSRLAAAAPEGVAAATPTLPRPLKTGPAWAATSATCTPRNSPGQRDGSLGPLRELGGADASGHLALASSRRLITR